MTEKPMTVIWTVILAGLQLSVLYSDIILQDPDWSVIMHFHILLYIHTVLFSTILIALEDGSYYNL